MATQFMTMAEVRLQAIREANKTITRPVFLGTAETPQVVQYQASDVLTIAKLYAAYIETGNENIGV